MNSLLSLTSTLSPASGALARDAATTDPAGSPFAAFLSLAAGGAEAAQPATGEALPSPQMPADLLLAPGIALPPVTGTGKFLPPDLPASSDAEPREEGGSETAVDLAATSPFIPPLLMALPQPMLAQAIAQATADTPVSSGAVPLLQPALLRPQAGAKTAPSEAAALAAPPLAGGAPTLPAVETSEPRLPLASERPLASPSSLAPQAPGAKEPAVVVSMDAAPAEARTPTRTPMAEGEPRADRSAALIPTPPATDAADQQPGQAPAKDTAAEAPVRLSVATASPFQPAAEAPVTTLSSVQPALASSPASAPAPLPQPAAMQELSAIVDRLTAAREALAPATAALALDHAEFGEITLRFEQQQDGQLTVGLSGSTAEAHRAVAAALAAERNPFGGDRPASDSQQQNGQARNTNGGLDRGSSSGGSASGNAGSQPGGGQARHDTPRQPSSNPGRQSARTNENARGGIYA